jgi:hypothetical protein
MKVRISELTIFALVINQTEGDRLADVVHTIGSDRELAIDALITYFNNGMNERDETVRELLEIIVSAIEKIKMDHPALAAQIRKMNIEYLKDRDSLK